MMHFDDRDATKVNIYDVNSIMTMDLLDIKVLHHPPTIIWRIFAVVMQLFREEDNWIMI